jgi:hypothetical protein
MATRFAGFIKDMVKFVWIDIRALFRFRCVGRLAAAAGASVWVVLFPEQARFLLAFALLAAARRSNVLEIRAIFSQLTDAGPPLVHILDCHRCAAQQFLRQGGFHKVIEFAIENLARRS